MQSIEIEIIASILGLMLPTLFGGLVTKYVIHALESKERERQGDFLALIYLLAAENHIIIGEKGGVGAIVGQGWRSRQTNIVNSLIQSAARSQKKYREKLYRLAKRISRTNIENTSLHVSSIEIHSMIEEMEASYFKRTSKK